MSSAITDLCTTSTNFILQDTQKQTLQKTDVLPKFVWKNDTDLSGSLSYEQRSIFYAKLGELLFKWYFVLPDSWQYPL